MPQRSATCLRRGPLTYRATMGKPKPDVSLLWEKYSFGLFTGRFYCPETGYEYRGNHCSRSHQLSINTDHRYPYGVCVFTWLHGRWPADGMHIDHVDHNPFNHRPWNIRELPAGVNLRRKRVTHKSQLEPLTPIQAPVCNPPATVPGVGRYRTTFKAPNVHEVTGRALYLNARRYRVRQTYKVITTIQDKPIMWWA